MGSLTVSRSSTWIFVTLVLLFALGTKAQTVTTNVAVGGSPVGVAVNPSTNKIYVADYESNDVTVIDGATNTTTSVAAGTNPYAVAVNPATNKIYVANKDNSNVTVIDGASRAITIGAGGGAAGADAVH